MKISERMKNPYIAILIVLLMLLPNLAFISTAFAEETPSTVSRASSRADNDLAVVDIPTPDDLDKEVQSTVEDNAIPTGTQAVQARIKNVGNLDQSGGPIPVEFNFETGTENVLWSDDMEGGTNGWTTEDLTQDNYHWHYTNVNAHGAGNSLTSNYQSGPHAGYYGNWWEEVAEMTSCVNIPSTPASEPYLQLWNFTDTQAQSDGGRVQMQIGSGTWVDIEPHNPYPPPALSYRGSITSSTSILSQGKGAFTTSKPWLQSEIFPLWTQNVGNVNGTCVKFRLWFTSDGSNPSEKTGWFVDDVQVHDGSSIAWSDDMENTGSGNWVFKNMLALGPSNGFEQLDGSGVERSTAWWVGNVSRQSYINGTDHVLSTPSIDLTGGGMNEARMTFWHKYAIDDDDGGWVEVSNDGGSTWAHVEPHFDLSTGGSVDTKYPGYLAESSAYGKIGVFTGNESSWHKATFDLTQYIGDTVHVRFHFNSDWDNDNGGGWFIDDVKVKTWDFQAHGSDSTNINSVNAGAVVNAQVNYDFDTETDFRISAQVALAGDQDTSNDEWRIVVRVKNIRDFELTTDPQPDGFTRTANHGEDVKYWMNITNTGNLPDDLNLTLNGLPADWNATINPETIGNLNPGSDPFLVTITLETTVDSGPTTYPDDTLQTKDYIMTLNISSDLDPTNAMDQELVAQITNTRPTVDFLQENLNGKVYTPFQVPQPISDDADGDDETQYWTYIWDWGDGSAVENSSSWDVTHIYSESTPTDPYTITLEVFDGLVKSEPTTVNVSIKNDPPNAKFVIESIPVNNTYAVGDPILFNASSPEYSTDENPGGLTFRWDFGDGNTADGATVNHTYEEGGEMDVNLTVIDEEDAIAYADETIMINTPPTAVITSPGNLEEFYLGQEIEFNASESSDNEQDQNDLDFLWTSNIAGELGNQMVFTKTFTSDEHIGNHQVTLKVFDRKAKGIAYDVRNVVIKRQPQTPPVLEVLQDTPVVSPEEGQTTTEFTFSILFKDNDGDRPAFVSVVIDPGTQYENEFELTKAEQDDDNYKNGVLFQNTITGNSIGTERVHSFLFEAADERNDTNVVQTQVFEDKLRITREKLIQNSANDGLSAGIVFANVRYVGSQGQTPLTITVSSELPASAPGDLKSLGISVEITSNIDDSLWDYANLSFRFSSNDFETVLETMDPNTVTLFKLSGGSWQEVEEAENDGNVVSLDMVEELGTFALFGEEEEVIDNGGGGGGEEGFFDQYGPALLVVVVIVIVGVVLFLMFRRKTPEEKQWGGDEAIDLKIDITSGEGTEEIAPSETEDGMEAEEPEDEMDSVEEQVAVYRPGGEGVTLADEEEEEEEAPSVWQPGGATEEAAEEETGEAEEAPSVWQPGAEGETETVEETYEEAPKEWSPGGEETETVDYQPPEEVVEPPEEATSEETVEDPTAPAEEPETPDLVEKPSEAEGTEGTEPSDEGPSSEETAGTDEGSEEEEDDLLDEILGED